MADATTQSGPTGPAEGTGARLTFRDMKLAILTLLDREGPLAQAELVASGLERHFARAFGPRERALAEESWNQLLHDGLIARDAPGRVGVTGEGAAALEKVALDPLDLGLARLAPHLVELRAAAWAAVAGESEAALRQVAQAPREIVDSVLAAAPASPVAASARNLVHAVDAAMAARLARGQAPTAQMMADAIRSAEIVIREALTGGYEHDR